MSKNEVRILLLSSHASVKGGRTPVGRMRAILHTEYSPLLLHLFVI